MLTSSGRYFLNGFLLVRYCANTITSFQIAVRTDFDWFVPKVNAAFPMSHIRIVDPIPTAKRLLSGENTIGTKSFRFDSGNVCLSLPERNSHHVTEPSQG